MWNNNKPAIAKAKRKSRRITLKYPLHSHSYQSNTVLPQNRHIDCDGYCHQFDRMYNHPGIQPLGIPVRNDLD